MASRQSVSNIPLPPPLKLHTGELALNWRRFKSQWCNYELATDVLKEEKGKRTAIFLSCIGSDAYDVFQSMVFSDEADRADIEAVIKAFDEYCIGETNVTYERYTLNKRVQEANESFDSFLTELRRLVKSCDYGELEESILKDRIVIGIREDSTRRKLLQIRRLDLASALDVCRASETATRHLREIRGTEDVHRVAASASTYDRARSKSRERRQGSRGEEHRPRVAKSCKYCGKPHEFKKELCPAYNKKCNQCGKLNHFASMCKSKSDKRSNRSNQACKQLNVEDDTDSEDVFTVNTNQSQHFKKKLFVRLNVGDSLVRFQMDSGASVNICCEAVARKALGQNYSVRPADAILRMFDNTILNTVGMITTTVVNPKTNESFQLDFYVAK